MTPAQRHREQHARRVLAEYPTKRLRVLLDLATRHGYWEHCDWGIVRAELGKTGGKGKSGLFPARRTGP